MQSMVMPECRLCSVSFRLIVTHQPFMLTVIMLNVSVLSVLVLTHHYSSVL
jgi:hypothetical protein